MQIETLKDVIQWTQLYHQKLSKCMQECKTKQTDERAQLLLDYLIEHEEKISSMLPLFEAKADKNTLDTWCIEYIDKSPINPYTACNLSFANLSTQEIITEIETQHNHIIELYRYLIGRASIPSYIELMTELVSMEEHEAKNMMQGANRLEDL